MTAFVYTFLASDGTALYVGCTEKIGYRFRTHGTKPWWPAVARIEVDAFAELDAGLLAETARIRELQPVHNMTMTDKYTDAGGWATRRAHLAGDRCRNPECFCGRAKAPDALTA